MARFFSQSLIDEIHDRVDIVEIISSYIPLKRAGRNFKALCPFHHEKTPSFIVNPDKQIYHCFGCGQGGNVFSFLMKYDRMSFPEAMEMLAKRAGVQLPMEKSQDLIKRDNLNNQLYKVNQLAACYYRNLLKSNLGKEGKVYLNKRGISEETMVRFQLGYALDSWSGLLSYAKKNNLNLEILERAGLIVHSKDRGYFDRFRNKVLFPIFDLRMRVVGFGARTLPTVKGDNEALPKYINSPETPVYTKGRNLYGLNLAHSYIRQRDYCIVVEGYMDVLTLHQFGFRNTVSPLGTALTVEQIRLLARFSKNVVMVYDSDEAGQMATLRGLDTLIEEGLKVKVVDLPLGFDPDSFIRQKGTESFQMMIDSSKNLYDYKLGILVSKYDPKIIEQKARIAEEMLLTINRIPNAVLKSSYIRNLAEALSIREESLLIELKKLKKSFRFFSQEKGLDSRELKSRPAERMLVKLMLEKQDSVPEIRKRLGLSDFQDPSLRKIVELFFQFASEGKTIKPSKLIDYFEDESIGRVISDLVTSAQDLMNRKKIIEDCIRWIERDRLNRQLKDLEDRIRLLQSTANEKRLAQLVSEYNGLIKQKKSGQRKNAKFKDR